MAQIDRAISATSSRDFAPFAPHSRRRPGPPQIAEEVARARLSGFQPVLLRQKPGRGTAGFLEDRALGLTGLLPVVFALVLSFVRAWSRAVSDVASGRSALGS